MPLNKETKPNQTKPSKMQSRREDTLEERYAIKFCFKLRKGATETYGMFRLFFDHLA